MQAAALRNTFNNLGHLSLYSGCYAAGCVLLVLLAMDLPMDWPALGAGLATTWFVYLLHRTRVARRPGVTWSQRVLYYGKNRSLVRCVLWASGVLSFIMLFFVDPWACLLVPASVFGMLCYGHGSDGKRVRDRLYLKNAVVALSMAAFCMALAFFGAVEFPGDDPTMATVLLVLFLLVLSDAILCDFADTEADQRTGTRTMPIRFGHARARIVSDTITFGSALILLSLWLIGSVSPLVGLGVPLLIVSTQFLLRRFKAEKLRHAVDLRMPLAVFVVFLVVFSSST